jgi:hypothetical protein
MTPTPHRGHARLTRELLPFLGPALVLLAYAALRLIHAALAGDRGVLAPSGSVDPTLAALTFAVFLLRLLALFVVPFIVAYRLVMRMLRRWVSRPASPSS